MAALPGVISKHDTKPCNTKLCKKLISCDPAGGLGEGDMKRNMLNLVDSAETLPLSGAISFHLLSKGHHHCSEGDDLTPFGRGRVCSGSGLCFSLKTFRFRMLQSPGDI